MDGNESGSMSDVVSLKFHQYGDAVVSDYDSGFFLGQGYHHSGGTSIPGPNFVSGTITADLNLVSQSTF